MTIRFAAARPATTAHFGTSPRRMGAFRPANDNHGSFANTAQLRGALEHFARHGLAAAGAAADNAATARSHGDSAGTAHWLEICATFDRRLAARVRQLAPAPDKHASPQRESAR